jgi:hypothetical protein
MENPILHDGEPGFERDTGRMKIGDGYKTWTELEYFAPDDPEDPSSIAEHVDSLLPHPVYDDGPSLDLLYENAKV